jgi:hypothetical protein
MPLEDLEELIVVDVGQAAVEHVLGDEAEMRHQLSGAHAESEIQDSREAAEDFLLSRCHCK